MFDPSIHPATAEISRVSPILWMDEILHHLQTMGNHCLLVFTGESNQKPGFLRWCLRGFRPSTVWLYSLQSTGSIPTANQSLAAWKPPSCPFACHFMISHRAVVRSRYPEWVALVNGTDQKLRSIFWWFNFDPYPYDSAHLLVPTDQPGNSKAVHPSGSAPLLLQLLNDLREVALPAQAVHLLNGTPKASGVYSQSRLFLCFLLFFPGPFGQQIGVSLLLVG